MSVSKWKNNGPKKLYPKLLKLLGNPIFTSNTPYGMAYWKTRGLFSEHLLKDEHIKHCVPAPHVDYFYSSIKFYVPPEYFKRFCSISGSIACDGLKKLITARCAGIGANIATLYLGMALVDGKMSIQDIKKKGLYNKYIRGEEMTHSEMRKEMIKMKKKNNKKYKKELKEPFYKLAFPHC